MFILLAMSNELATNRRAYFDYEILETLEAGIVLLGSEVKSLRVNGASLQEGFVRIEKGEAWLIAVSIAPYSFGGAWGHEERRNRKLLLHRKEINRLEEKTKEKGLTIIPLALYLKEGKIKIKIGIGKGKKHYDKRKKLKEKETRDEIRKNL